ncbi:MAG TPA: IPT/TIG domain-containing protein [Solirubrobacteraceae bacterium]|nr:IPT/TIG domain-containing protein [Solirubrobacteraceae bacterium]
MKPGRDAERESNPGSAGGPSRGLAALALLVVALGAALVVLASAASGSPAPVRVGLAPRVPIGARAVGAVPASSAISGAVALKPRDEAALTKFIGEVTDKSSATFGQYLAPGAFASRFGPTQATVAAVESSLQADGLRVSSVSGDHLLVGFSGSAAQVERAFRTGLESYRLADGSVTREATAAAAVAPAIAGSVVGVLGLSDLVHEHPEGLVRAPVSAEGKITPAKSAGFEHPAGSPTPCKDASEDAIEFGGLTDDQIAHAYGAFGLYSDGDLGAGQTVGIYELEQFAPSDIRHFDQCFFGAKRAASMASRLSVIPVDGGQPKGLGEVEADLDIEDVSAMAPGASIDVYEAPNNATGAIDEWAAIIGADRERVITTSWGDCEQEVQLGEPGIQQAENFLFEQAAAQGQTVFSAAGDTGSDDCNAFRTPNVAPGQNPLSVDDPGSQPYVVSAGGTTITDAETQPAQEHVWNDGAEWGAGGGGISMSWAMPSWQLSSKVPGIVLPGSADYTNADSIEKQFGYPQNFCQAFLPGATATTPCRTVPDVSAQADEFTGAVTIYSKLFKSEVPDGWITIGGTSSAAPTWAAMLTEVNASATCAEHPATADGVGFAAPLLYGVASNPAEYAASFNDITEGNNDIYGLDDGKTYPATGGYDLASGLGSPRLTDAGGTAGLAYYLCSLATSAERPVVSGLSPSSGSTAGGESVKVSGSGFESAAGADVAGVQVGSAHLSAADFRVKSSTSITLTMPPAKETLPPESPGPLDGAGPANVIVTLSDGESSAPGPGSTFQYVDTSEGETVPSITGVNPSGGLESAPQEVTILGSGFSAASKVSFGGVPAASFKVLSPFEIAVTPPAFSSHTACAPLPNTGAYEGEDAANDICQAQVRVSGPHGASAASTIVPPLEGPIAVDSEGAFVTPPGCGCEVRPAPSEFDYVPAPTITSVSTSAGPADLADEHGGTLVTIHGAGLNFLTMDWASLGDPAREAGQLTVFPFFTFLTGTEAQIVLPAVVAPGEATVNPVSLPFSFHTQAGQGPPASVSYAGVPTVTHLTNSANHLRLKGAIGALDTGGTPIELSGEGFSGQLLRVQFIDSIGPYSEGTQYVFDASSGTSLSTQTVSQNPGLDNTQACTVSGCSESSSANLIYLYPPGNPQVESISPASGSAAGGTEVAIHGQNLGCALGAFFGEARAEITPVETILDCGSTTVLYATSPPGSPGTKAPVTVTTVESFFTGSGHGSTTADFTYKKA